MDAFAEFAIVRSGLLLNQVRAQAVVGRALALKYPTREEWEAALNSAEVQSALTDLYQAVASIDAGLDQIDENDIEALQEAGAAKYRESLLALEALAAEWEVDAADLLTVVYTS